MPTIEEQRAIQAVVTARNISYLVHFTRLENLPFILQHGLQPRSVIDDAMTNKNNVLFGKKTFVNDDVRVDDKREYNCLSISFPNHRMFWGCRQDTAGNWVILLLHPRILWEKDCLFYHMNAASNCVRFNDIEEHMGANALTRMFLQSDDIPRDNFLLPADPTDEQAEVMISGVIESSYIYGIVFDNKELADEYANRISDKKFYYCEPNTKLYNTRKAYRYGH